MPAQRRDRMRSLVVVLCYSYKTTNGGCPRFPSLSLCPSLSLYFLPDVRIHKHIYDIVSSTTSPALLVCVCVCVSVLEVMLSILIAGHFLVCCAVFWCAVCNSYFSTLFRCFTCTKTVIIIWFRNEREENEKKKDWFSTWNIRKKWTKLLIESVSKVVHSTEKRGECKRRRQWWRRRRRRTERLSIKSHLFLLIAHIRTLTFYYYVVHTD